MNTYFIAIFSHYDAVNKLHVIIAKNHVDAAKQAILLNTAEQHRTDTYKEWIDKLGDSVGDITKNAALSGLVISEALVIEP